MNAATDHENTPEPSHPPNSADPPLLPQASAPKSAGLSVNSILATVECLTPAEQIQLLTDEEVIRTGWNGFVEVGFALVDICRNRLYKQEFDRFEQSCRQKWQCAPRRAYYLISAAQILRHLCTNCADRKPDDVWQLRRLIRLTPEQEQLAWSRAEALGGGASSLICPSDSNCARQILSGPTLPQPLGSRP